MLRYATLLCSFFLLSNLLQAQNPNWKFTGPSNFPTNISGQINGIGRVCQIKFDPTDSSTIYACSASGGLWKSINEGNTWQLVGTDTLPIMGTSSVCIDYTNPDIIYLSSGDPNYYSTDFGIWKSMDGGQTWALANNGIDTRMAVEILMDPTNHLHLIAATNNGIWKTTDGGMTWQVKLPSYQCTDMMWQPVPHASILYASSMNKFFRSADAGETWVEITIGLTGMLASGTRIAVSAQHPEIVYVATIKDEGTIFKSVDSGQSFTIQYHNPAYSLTGYDTLGGGQGNYNFCIEANPDNANQLFLASHNIWRSDDGGVSWNQLTQWWKTVHTDMHDYAFQPGNSNQLFNANDGGIWLSTSSGSNWVQKSDGLGATENYHAAVSPLYAGLISTGTQDNGELVYLDSTWKTNRGGDWTTRMLMDYSAQKFVYYLDDKERRALPSSSDQSYAIPSSITGASLNQIFSPDSQQVSYISGTNVWRSTNGLDVNPIWTQITTLTSGTIKCLAICKGHPNILAYSVSNKFFITHNALDPIPIFTSVNFPITGTATDIAISSMDTNKVFVVLGSKVYLSADGGTNFANYSGTLPAINHTKIYLQEYGMTSNLYLGNPLGVYFRSNGMSDWINYSGDLPNIATIKDILYFNDGGEDARLYVTYYGRGTWETKLEQSSTTCGIPVLHTVQVNPGTINVGWSNVGASQYEVAYRELGTLAWNYMVTTSNSVNITSFAGCMHYEVRVRSRCATDSSLWSKRRYFETLSNPLTNFFDAHQDIGNVGMAGSVCYDAIYDRYTLFASGEDIWDKKDEFHFLYKKLKGDVSISARVKHIGNIYGWAKGGVMIRESLATDSKHAMCALTPGNGFAMQWRENTNDWSSNKDTAGKAPGWVRLERNGNQITSYFSLDGLVWDVLETATISMNDSVYVGLANCSHVDTVLNDAVFDNIIFNGNMVNTPILSSLSADINVYPNPAKNEMHIAWNLGEHSIKNIAVYDMLGKKVIEETVTTHYGKHVLSVSSLSKGVYFLFANGKQNRFTKFVKE